MALIAMAVFDTDQNQRYDYTRRTLESLSQTVDWTKHRLVVIDNNSCGATKALLNWYLNTRNRIENPNRIKGIKVIFLEKNIGTAEAINLAWKERKPGENCIKMDNDVVFHQKGWVDDMEEVIRKNPKIGQVGLKRKELEETPLHTNPSFKSVLKMLPHERGEKWYVIEVVNHVIGTCVMHSSALLDKVGYLFQLGVYGFDDSFMSHRSLKSGFINCFLPSIEIDHIDNGENPYTEEKKELANQVWQEYQKVAGEIISGKRSVYYNPFYTSHTSEPGIIKEDSFKLPIEGKIFKSE